MSKSIKIFKSFEEQEQYHLELMANSSVIERFRALYQMQQLPKNIHPLPNNKRRIIIYPNKTKG